MNAAAAGAIGAAPDAEGFAALKRAIIARTGHHYYTDKDALLADRLQRRLSLTGCAGYAAYLALLAHPRRGVAEWRELEAEVTIGETFFFRHAEQFAALRDTVLPALLRANARPRALRIWSAGCAIGAEPYSLAILLERLLGPAMRDWTIEIIGSDLSARSLAQAEEGLFGDWALRGLPEADRRRDFQFLPERRLWRIADRHRRLLRFEQHNLLSLLDGSAGPAWSGFDLILCRNVLIYFSAAQIPPMLSALARALSPAGWLMVGHSDAIAALPRDLRMVELPGTMAFRPPTAAPLAPVPPASPVLPAAPLPPAPAWVDLPLPAAALPAVAAPRAAPSALETKPVAAEPRAPSLAPSLALIRALADAGQLEEAARAASLALAADPLDARLHFYDGVIAQALGEGARAEAALRRAVYLAGDMVMAHYHLGLALLGQGVAEAGRRALAQALWLCNRVPPATRLPEGDGLTARDLAERVQMQLRPGGRR